MTTKAMTTVGPTATTDGAAPATRAENGGPVAGLTVDIDKNTIAEWCDEHRRYHQAREQRVPCQRCKRPTVRFHAICESCREAP